MGVTEAARRARSAVRGERLQLLVGRMAEQGSIALIGVLVAWDSTPEEYFPFAALLIITSVSAIVASLGINLDVLSRRSVRFRRRDAVGVGLVSAAVVAGAALASLVSSPVVALAVAGVWVGNAYGQIGKASLIRDGRVNVHLRVELLSLAVMWPAYFLLGGSAVSAGSIAIGSAAIAQAAFAYRPGRVFGGSTESRGLLILSTQATAVAAGNADYVVASVLLPSGLFSVYVLAFRLANAVNSQVLSAIIRIYMRDFDLDESPQSRQRLFDRTIRQAGLLGVFGGIGIVPVLVLVRVVIGPDWDPVAAVGTALAIGIPCRALTVVAGTSLLVSLRERTLTSLEVVRAVVFTLSAVCGAAIGVVELAIAVTIGAALNCWIFQRAVHAQLGLDRSLPLRVAPAVTLLLASCSLLLR